MKKAISILMCFVLIFSTLTFVSIPASAEELRDGDYYYTVSNGEATITYCATSISGNITIPSTLGGYPVTSIGYSAFKDCSSLTSITIPDSVTSIGVWAFYYCTSLTSITIPDSVTSIGSSAFSGTGYYYDEKNWENDVLYIGNHLIYANESLSGNYSIKQSTKTIADYAFYYCKSLTSITIPDSVTSIGYYAFYNCKSLTSVTIPDSVTSIGDCAFYDCSSLTSITIPNSVTSIGDYAFMNCSSLTGVNITDLKAWCEIEFANYDANPLCYARNLYLNGKLVTDLVIPQGITKINAYAFNYCSSLTSITIPNSVTSIGDYAFYWCSSLKTITIPDSVTSVSKTAFGEYSYFNLIIAEGSTKITKAMVISKNLYSVTIPDSVTTIEEDAFYNCTSLNRIYIPASVTTIGKHALGYHDSIETFGESYDLIEDFTIQGYKNTAAEIYAKENGIEFEDLTFEEPTTQPSTTVPSVCAHLYKTVVGAINPTYDSEGYTGDLVCCDCGTVISLGKVIAKLKPTPSTTTQTVVTICQHPFNSVVVINSKPATYDSAGYTGDKVCGICGETIEKGSVTDKLVKPTESTTQPTATQQPTTVQPTIQPSTTVPSVCAHAFDKIVVKNVKVETYFSTGYTGDKVCGDCGKQLANGSVINKLTLKTPKFKLTSGKKQFKVKYTKVKDATGFQVRYKLKGKWITKTFATKKTATKAIKKLKKGTYQVQGRAMIQSGKQKAFSAWSKVSKS